MRTALLAAALSLAVLPAAAQTTTTYPTLKEFRQSGDYDEIFQTRIAQSISRIDRVPTTDQYRWWRACLAGDTGSCQTYLKWLEGVFREYPNEWKRKPTDWVEYAGPKINSTQFNIYLLRNVSTGGDDPNFRRERFECIMYQSLRDCSVFINYLKLKFASEQKRYQANPFLH